MVCWTRERSGRFFASDSWAFARDLFEQRVEELAPGQPIQALRRQYSALDRGGEAGGGIPPAERRPVGVFNALVLARDVPCDAFLLFGSRMVPALGPAARIDVLAEDVRRRDPRARCDRYSVGSWEAPDRPPSEVRPTPHAQLAADRCIRERNVDPAATAPLTTGELLWVGEIARQRDESHLALCIAGLVLQRDYTTGGLNLKAAALRDLFSYDQSLAVYDASIELCASAKNNPYAHIGRAATLRRLLRDDEAYDSVKKALRFWPNDPYALRVRDAIMRGLAVRDEADRTAA